MAVRVFVGPKVVLETNLSPLRQTITEDRLFKIVAVMHIPALRSIMRNKKTDMCREVDYGYSHYVSE